jgi:hypothetical protein
LYLQAVERVVQRSAILNELGLLETADQQKEFLETEALPVFASQAAVRLVAEDEVNDAAEDIGAALERGIDDEAEWVRLRQNFIDAAQTEIFPGE